MSDFAHGRGWEEMLAGGFIANGAMTIRTRISLEEPEVCCPEDAVMVCEAAIEWLQMPEQRPLGVTKVIIVDLDDRLVAENVDQQSCRLSN